MATTRRRRKYALIFAALFLIVNLPLMSMAFTKVRLDRGGQTVSAVVTDHEPLDGGGGWVEFRYDRDTDADQGAYSVRLDDATYTAAVESGQLEVETVPGSPALFRVDGQRRAGTGWVFLLVANLVVAGLAWLILSSERYGGRRGRAETLHLEATADLEATLAAPAVTDLGEERFEVTGTVLSADAHEVVIDAAGRLVVLILDGHLNPVALQERVRGWGRALD